MRERSPYWMILVALVVSCMRSEETPLERSKDQPGHLACLEGVVGYYVEEAAIGGEVDPSGFILLHPKWHDGEPDFPYNRVYLSGQIDSTYLGKRVLILGSLNPLVIYGVERGIRTFVSVEVLQIMVLPSSSEKNPFTRGLFRYGYSSP